jgi:hypothetical protein
MMDVLAIPLKNIFSKRAPKVVNALSKFVNNVAQGFGIKLTRANGSLVIALDTTNILLVDWIKLVTRENIRSIVSTDLSGQMSDDFDAEYDSPPITPEIEDGEYLWQPMTKDEENSTDTQTYYRGYKENAVIAIEDNDGSHKLWWVEKEYSPDGRLKSVSKLKGVTIIGA